MEAVSVAIALGLIKILYFSSLGRLAETWRRLCFGPWPRSISICVTSEPPGEEISHPAAATLTLAQLRQALGLKYQFMIDDLARHHATAGKTADDVRVRLLESYSRAYPIYLQTDPDDGGRSKVYLPTADGVFATPTDSARKCDDKSFVCETLSTPNTLATPYDVTIVVGWSVVLGSNVSTGGQSLVVIADRFASGGYTLDTIVPPLGYPPLRTDPSLQRHHPTSGFAYKKAGSGNDGRGSASLFVLVNTLESLHADTTGQHGQDGADADPPGVPYQVARCGAGGCSYYWECSFDGKQDPGTGLPKTDGLMDGGNGGKGGQAGNAFVRFATLLAAGETPKTDALCFATANACAAAPCGWNPSNTVCDHLREADDPTCSDKVDNDADQRAGAARRVLGGAAALAGAGRDRKRQHATVVQAERWRPGAVRKRTPGRQLRVSLRVLVPSRFQPRAPRRP